ncbi:MAG: transposase [Saprospiraceae bacterium]
MKIKHYVKNLPHIHPANSIYFVTFRLEGSVPIIQLQKLNENYELKKSQIQNESLEIKNKVAHEYKAEKESLLEQIDDGPRYLKIPEIAKIVMSQLHLFDRVFYDLVCYCIMSNHVHVLFDTSIQTDLSRVSLDKILKKIKGPTAVKSNRFLGRSGKFWMLESYDHYIRNDKELSNVYDYILNNPVKANLVDDWRDWEYSYPKVG